MDTVDQHTELELRIVLEPGEEGGLTGRLEATNTADHPVRLDGKPRVTPLAADGTPLDVTQVVSLEMRIPSHVDVLPGGRARAAVGWGGWDGPDPGDRWEVRLGGAAPVRVPVEGPTRPPATGPATNTWSSWWELA